MEAQNTRKNIKDAGRHKKFFEESIPLTVRVPISRKAEVKAEIETILKKYRKGYK